MSTPNDLIDRYFAAWNETDPARRREIVAKTWTPAATYLDPMLQGEGQDGIDAMIGSVQQRFPGHRFEPVGDIDAHHDRLRFSWRLLPPDGQAIVHGTDFGVVASGDRLQSVTGFFDRLPAA